METPGPKFRSLLIAGPKWVEVVSGRARHRHTWSRVVCLLFILGTDTVGGVANSFFAKDDKDAKEQPRKPRSNNSKVQLSQNTLRFTSSKTGGWGRRPLKEARKIRSRSTGVPPPPPLNTPLSGLPESVCVYPSALYWSAFRHVICSSLLFDFSKLRA